MTRRIIVFFASIAAAMLFSHPLYAQKESEWPTYGNDPGGSRYSPLKQINDHNVHSLRPAWVFHTGELETYAGTPALKKAAFETTPIMVGHTLYFSTPSCRVFALDAVSGKQKWMFDPKIDLNADLSEITSRGVSVWPAPQQGPPGSGSTPQRIFVGTIDGRLIALDAKNGRPIFSFGDSGAVNLRAGLGDDISVTSPPAIIGNLVIVGSSIGDNQRIAYPRGLVRAYDALTGALRWSWDPIPENANDPAWSTWEGDKPPKAGAANAWSILSVDIKRDLVFIPTGSASPDYYGGERKGQNLYANSIVVLRASTGKMIWHFQVVHHDLWDYDLAAQPMLIDVTRHGKSIPAVAVGTKSGFIFLFDRRNGKALFPIEERPVPMSTVAGEKAWPTQPFPSLPAPLGLQRLTADDSWGPDSLARQHASAFLSKYENKGIFTPPSLKGLLETPGNTGGIHWGGMCFDPVTQSLVTNVNRTTAVITLIPREELSLQEKQDSFLAKSETGRQIGTPYVMKRGYAYQTDSLGNRLLQTAPPWGTLDAIDMSTGKKEWEVPLGFDADPAIYPDAEKWGSINLGGAIVTAGKLIFVAASKDGYFRAFRTGDGQLLWKYRLPAGGQATPMTYAIHDRQYIVIAAGGHGKFGTKQGDAIVAFSN